MNTKLKQEQEPTTKVKTIEYGKKKVSNLYKQKRNTHWVNHPRKSRSRQW